MTSDVIQVEELMRQNKLTYFILTVNLYNDTETDGSQTCQKLTLFLV